MYKGREKWLPILFSFATTFLFYTPTLFTSIVWLLWFSNRKFNCYSSHFLGRGNWGGPRAGPDRERERKKPKFSWSDLKRTSGSNIYRGKKHNIFSFQIVSWGFRKHSRKAENVEFFFSSKATFFLQKKGLSKINFSVFLHIWIVFLVIILLILFMLSNSRTQLNLTNGAKQTFLQLGKKIKRRTKQTKKRKKNFSK